jgi:hypothetical protein
LTLVELLAVSAIILMMAGTLGSFALSVQNTNQHQFRQGLALQHGQITLVRLQRQLHQATANSSFPGFVAFPELVGSHTFPDTLVVWRPDGPPVDPEGLPRINELVVYCPNPSAANELWEITKPADVRAAPPLSDAEAWRHELASFRTGNQAQRIVLTDLLRVARLHDGTGTPALRAVLRFESVRRPSATQWADYVRGTSTWESLSWVQGIHGPTTGLSQTQCRIEFQLRPADQVDDQRDVAIPFFGSAVVYFNLKRS